jgi:hypothetical protein
MPFVFLIAKDSAWQHQSGRQPLGGNGGDSQDESVIARPQSEWAGDWYVVGLRTVRALLGQ